MHSGIALDKKLRLATVFVFCSRGVSPMDYKLGFFVDWTTGWYTGFALGRVLTRAVDHFGFF